MDDAGKRVDRLSVDHDVHFYEVAGLILTQFVVHGAVAPGDAFQPVVEIDQDFVERQYTGQHDPGSIQGIRVLDRAPFFHDQGHDVAHRGIGNVDRRFDGRLVDFDNRSGFRQVHGIVDFNHRVTVLVDVVDHARIGGNDLDVVFATDAFLDDLHVEQPQEAAAKTKTEGQRAFGLINERRVVEAQPTEGGLEFFVVV